ncbi:MAG: 3'-5' exonuclease domain-containing protein 2 [Muribaculaceae bacterium]|nr:3'-5' exonuclease domain-containing protein 2 [Muribaculaceae bacterium]
MTPQEYSKAIVTISKEKLATLPAAVYTGKIELIDNTDKLNAAIDTLKKSSIIGFDTETRPSFRRGLQHKVSLIQLATPGQCFLFRTNLIGFPKELMEILENPDLLKVGLSTHDDFHNLRKIEENKDFEPQGFIDLQAFVKNFKIADNSLSRVYGILFGERISKGQRLTNWEAAELTQSQQEYAALDAFACINIYNYLSEGKFNPKDSEYLTLPPEPEPQMEETNEN